MSGAEFRAAAAKLMREEQLQDEILRFARGTAHWLAYHPYDSRRSEPGFPDLCLVRERVVFAELKREVGQLSPAQRVWRDRLVGAGAEWYLWRPSDWFTEEIQRVLTRGRR